MMQAGYSREDRAAGGNGYVPISLRYRPYTADLARETSLAGGDPLEGFANRSYRGKTGCTPNESDLDLVLDTRRVMGDKPVLVMLHLERPAIVAEFEPVADALVVSFGVQDQALFDMLSGVAEPSGLLPIQIPDGMTTVETQCEDLPLDMTCHCDLEGNAYDFGFGLSWSGVIRDERTARYVRHV